MKKLLALVLVVVMIMSFAACGQKNANVTETDLSQPVTIKWLMPGPGVQTDAPKVWAKFNEELHKVKGFENVTVEIEVIPVADYSQKVMLMQTSGDQIDILQTYTLNYATEYRDGTIIDLTDYMYLLKDTTKEVPEWVIEMGKVDGGQAIIPNYQKMVTAPWGLVIPEDHKQYVEDWDGFVEKLTDVQDHETYYTTIENEYLSKVKAAGDIDKGWSINGYIKNGDTIINPFNFDNATGKVHHRNVTPDGKMPDSYNWHRKFFKAGYIRKDILSAKQAEVEGKPEGAIMWKTQCWPGYEENLSQKFGMPVVAFRGTSKDYIPYKPGAGGLAIPSNSKYPDVAMKVINLLNCDKGIELYNLLVYGIEGEHYTVEKELEGGDKYITPKDYVGQGSASARYGLWNWVVGNAENAYVTSNEKESYKKDIYEIQNINAERSPLIGFVPDTTSIDIKLSQLNAIKSDSGLWEGIHENVDEVYEAYVNDLKAAGLDEAQAELQNQVDAFLANK